MKAMYVVRSDRTRDMVQCASVQDALQSGQRRAMKLSGDGMKNIILEVYELVATGAVETTSTIKIEKAVKP